MTPAPPVGLLIGSHIPPAEIGPLSTLAEEAGFGEIWLPEDLWYTSGIVCAGAALAATRTIPVGLGIHSAVTRHASIQALDFATLSHVYPGRFWPGIGLGLPSWLDQMGLRPKSGIRAVGETVRNVRRLLAGETVSDKGTHLLDDIRLAYPLDTVPPLYIGAVGPQSIRQTGRIADGLVVSVTAGTAYTSWARQLLDEGAAEAGRPRPRMVTFALFCVDDDPVAARAALRPTVGFYLTAMQGTDLVRVYGIEDELAAMTGDVGENLPEQWLEDLTVSGTPVQCAAKIDELLAAGSDAVILFPAPVERGRALAERAGQDVLPRVTR
ncbi:LLM class flavin-dependent oxidoreductase [Amycolatopsis jejuensis]|uniref:LLM class flavin-dependent oxidoreductase n=1 Tax=Amycolatopsis jejuensis TaxID=330084 RepID=UPI000527A195|nr:LLM class flavin-dependent oxidoreductase [Amycolatopsis jejuensis]